MPPDGVVLSEALQTLASRARSAANHADAAAAGDASSMSGLLTAMLAFRATAVGYLGHPSVGDYVWLDAAKYDGKRVRRWSGSPN